MSAYLGDSVEIDEGMKSGWIYWTHIRDPFYVYSYSSGLLISKGLQSMVREDRKNIDKVKMFLSSGSSLSPKDLFMKIGIDITDEEFWKKGLNDVENLLETAQVK
jgi:oligoendopeptidase F